MLIERHGAQRSHGHLTLAHIPAHVYGAPDTNWAIFRMRGRYGVPDKGTTHVYTVMLSKEEILEALGALLGESSHPKVSGPVCSVLKELLKRKKRSRR